MTNDRDLVYGTQPLCGAMKPHPNSVYVIAEVGSTHDGSIGNAIEMVKLWAECGADAVKFQDHRWEQVDAEQFHPNDRVKEKRKAYYERTGFDVQHWNWLRKVCLDNGVDFIVSPFSVEAAREQADRVTAFKVASGQVTNLELLQTLREIGKPVHLSTGMSTVEETAAALDTLRPHVASVMQCTSEYPCPPERVGLNLFLSRSVDKLMHDMARPFLDITAKMTEQESSWHPMPPVGFSDHTMGIAASLVAISMGATVIERHVTPSRHLYGSDAAHSLTPDEFRTFVREVRDLEKMLANPVDKDALARTEAMQAMRKVFLHAGS